MRKTGFSLLWTILVALFGCGPSDGSRPRDAEPQQPQVELNVAFRLSVSETVEIPTEDLRVTLVAVPDDSRCPIGVRCVWAGQATALIRLEKEGRSLAEVKLTRQPGQSEPSKELADGYEVVLTGIEPYPEEGKTIQPSDYVAVLIVRREN